MAAILARKLGMTQIFGEDGAVARVTVLAAGPCHVTAIRTAERDGYDAVQLAFGASREKALTKPELGHLAKADAPPLRHLVEFRGEGDGLVGRRDRRRRRVRGRASASRSPGSPRARASRARSSATASAAAPPATARTTSARRDRSAPRRRPRASSRASAARARWATSASPSAASRSSRCAPDENLLFVRGAGPGPAQRLRRGAQRWLTPPCSAARSATRRARRGRLRRPLQRPAAARVGARRARGAPPRHRRDARRAASSPAATRSRGARRAPAARAPARPRSPIFTGGGAVFGPHPRSYTFKVNRKERRAALRSALSLHAERGSIAILDAAAFDDALDQGRRGAARRLGPAAARRSSSSRAEEREAGAVVPQHRARRRADALERRRRRHRRRRLDALLGRRARRADRARRSARRGARRSADGALPGDHPPGRLREELRARRRRQVHLPRPRRRAQDADPPGGRGALRRARRGGPHDVGQVQAEAPRHARAGARAPGRRRSSRSAPARRSRSSPASKGRRPDADPQAQADERRDAASSPTPTSPRSRKTEPERSLVEGLTKSGGRNALGRKTSRHRGGGAKRLYRRIDFKRRKDGVPGARRGDRVRPQPHRLHRAAALRRRREALHPRAGAADASG